jgi:uncharacterized protein YjbI with pentapeptide repeats
VPPAFHAPRIPSALEPVDNPTLADGTSWEAASLSGDWSGVHAEDTEIVRSEATSLRLTGTHVVRPRISDCRFERCELSGAVFEEAALERVEFVDCRMSGALFPEARLRHVRFVGCRMDSVGLRMVVAPNVRFESCQLPGADLYAADLGGSAFIDCDLTGADVSQATLAGAKLHGSDLADVVGSAALRDVEIDPTQVVAVALAVFDSIGIRVTER